MAKEKKLSQLGRRTLVLIYLSKQKQGAWIPVKEINRILLQAIPRNVLHSINELMSMGYIESRSGIKDLLLHDRVRLIKPIDLIEVVNEWIYANYESVNAGRRKAPRQTIQEGGRQDEKES